MVEQFIAAGWGGPLFLEQTEKDCWHIDLAAINRWQLLQIGLSDFNIEMDSWCTCCRDDLFYSYRRDLGNTGRMIGFASIKAG